MMNIYELQYHLLLIYYQKKELSKDMFQNKIV